MSQRYLLLSLSLEGYLLFVKGTRNMFSRSLSRRFKVAVVGAAGGIGQPLSLLLKMNPLVSHLALSDVANVNGVRADLSHISTSCRVSSYGKGELAQAVEGCDVVLIPAGVPRKPGMSRDDLFNINATIVRDVVKECAAKCPNACIAIISNPVNSTVPIAAEVLKKAHVYHPEKLFGVTTLDLVRAKTFLGEVADCRPEKLNVKVVGGHSGATIVPLLSQTGIPLQEAQVKALTQRIQFGGDEVVKAKDGAGSATLSMAVAASEFATALMRGLVGEYGVETCAFVGFGCEKYKNLPFFANTVQLGKDGIAATLPIGPISAFEEGLLAKCSEELWGNIKKGIEFGMK